jgi:aspartokinase/homoserine dehydrogenase 1
VTSAEKENKRLRFIASFEGGKGVISLKAVPVNHPFYALSGSDNMIVLHSNRYNRTPLVVRGPGAGADVTAAGVLAEIIGIAGLI